MRNVNIPMLGLIPVVALALFILVVTGSTTLDVDADASTTTTFARNPVNLDLAGWHPAVKPAKAEVRTAQREVGRIVLYDAKRSPGSADPTSNAHGCPITIIENWISARNKKSHCSPDDETGVC